MFKKTSSLDEIRQLVSKIVFLLSKLSRTHTKKFPRDSIATTRLQNDNGGDKDPRLREDDENGRGGDENGRGGDN